MFADIVYQSGDQYIQSLEDVQVGILIFIPCSIGFLMALLAIRGCYKIPSMNSPFGYLTKYQLFSQVIASLNSGGFYFFGVLLDFKFIINNSHICGLISTILIPLILSLYLMISLNRFLSLVAPMFYNTIFQPKIRRVLVFACYIVPTIYTIVFTWRYDCGYKFYHYGWVFSFIISETCGTKFEVLLRGVQSLLTNLMLLIDICTFVLLIFFRKRVLKTKSAEVRKREVNFGQQVVIQGGVFILFGIFYSFAYKWIPGDTPEKWKIFWTSSFLANLLHIFDTGVIFIFNTEFSMWLRSEKKTRDGSASVVTVVM
ncbi:unnamed protein product [Caenorhabditis angaria]|uniref:7TM GPCR serpentine receptor class x (Srx) domain-containing protein n=1 Tax=Caenorhabditis angaria TaxID=860376 RepID=A0A9P1IWV1_9PELO|nr:unnamed protein product [Caenorhabditis angaria]